MAQTTTTPAPMTIGIDLGDRYSYFAALDGNGEMVEEGRLRLHSDNGFLNVLRRAWQSKSARALPCRVRPRRRKRLPGQTMAVE